MLMTKTRENPVRPIVGVGAVVFQVEEASVLELVEQRADKGRLLGVAVVADGDGGNLKRKKRLF